MQKIRIENFPVISTNSIYAGKHWKKRDKDKEAYRWCFQQYAKKIQAITEKVDLHFTFYFSSNTRSYDSSNCSYMGKMFEDAMVKNGILKNDSRKYVRRFTTQSERSETKENYCVLTITEIDKDDKRK